MNRPSEPVSPVIRNIQAIADLERRAIQERSFVDRTTDFITRAAGSSTFVGAHVLLFGAWLWFNTHSVGRIDPYPFALLNLLVALEGIFLTSFVLMTQERMTRQADKRAHLDLQVNLLSEQELTTILHMLDALCRDAGVRVRVQDERVAALLKETDVHTLASALEDALPDPVATK